LSASELHTGNGRVNGAAPEGAADPPPPRSYGAGARILGAGIALTGVVTFAYFAVASHVLGPVAYKNISLLWSVMFVIVTIIYRPIEQLLSRSIAQHGHISLRTPLLIQIGFLCVFLAVALPLRTTITDDVFGGVAALYWILVGGVAAYAASYFARGWLAGHRRFGLYGGLVLVESTARFCFALAVAVGLASGQVAVALGMAAAPVLSLCVVPWAIRRRTARTEGEGGAIGVRHGSGFAAAVFGIQVAEQSLVNAAVIVVDATADDPALGGFVFNVLLIVRAPLQLFQAVQTSLLPHLAGGGDEGRAIRVTVGAIAAFAAAVTVGLLAIGPWIMNVVFGGDFDYGRGGLALVGAGMGLHLVAGTLTQSALARGRAAQAASAWLLCAALFVAWVAASLMSDVLLRVEVGYFGAAGLLAGLLFGLYRRPVEPEPAQAPA
jgi:O-antigen/teichoic acid export membrane protein